ncbi:type IV toxin-antitoxin system AbiEi family antitoxin [Actinomycetota bacterium]
MTVSQVVQLFHVFTYPEHVEKLNTILVHAQRSLAKRDIVLDWWPADPSADTRTDGTLIIELDGRSAHLPLVFKTSLRPSALRLQLDTAPRGAVIVSDHITECTGELLRHTGWSYLDSAGNAWIRADGVVIDIAGRRPTKPGSRRVQTDPLYSRSAMPVVLALLADPGLINQPMRETHARSGSSLGTVQKVVGQLRRSGFADISPDEVHTMPLPTRRRWNRLFNGWVTAYLNGTRDKEEPRRFTADTTAPALVDHAHGLALTGECAAAALGHDIRPTTLEFYARDTPKDFVKSARLRPDPAGSVIMRRPIWPEALDRTWPNGLITAPVPVVYADLVATQDPRLETLAHDLQAHEPDLRLLRA